MKVQYRAGEIDEAAYKVALDCGQSMQKRNQQETEDLGKMLKAATEPLSQPQQQPQPKQVARPPVQQVQQATTE